MRGENMEAEGRVILSRWLVLKRRPKRGWLVKGDVESKSFGWSFSFKDSRYLEKFKFCWEGSRREIWRGNRSLIVLNNDTI